MHPEHTRILGNGGSRKMLVGIPTSQKKISKQRRTGTNAYNFYKA
jgi:hypothetical protein